VFANGTIVRHTAIRTLFGRIEALVGCDDGRYAYRVRIAEQGPVQVVSMSEDEIERYVPTRGGHLARRSFENGVTAVLPTRFFRSLPIMRDRAPSGTCGHGDDGNRDLADGVRNALVVLDGGREL
jgi:hypothetical protein